MSLNPTRRNLRGVSKVKLGKLQPLPEPVEEMAVEVEMVPPFSYEQKHGVIRMLLALKLDGLESGNSTPSFSRNTSFDEDFGFDSADDSDQGRSWQLSGDTGSSGFGNSVASFMSWTDDVEVETTRKIQELLDELERCFYDEQSLDTLKKDVAAECCDWRSRFPHYRLRGTGIPSSSFQLQRLYQHVHSDHAATDEDEEGVEEVIACHGSCEESPELDEWSNSEGSRPDTAEGVGVLCSGRDFTEENLKQKVKDAVREQLFAHVWTEVSKSLEPLSKLCSERTLQQTSVATNKPSGKFTNLTVDVPARAFTPISDIRDSELDNLLHVKSLHRSARKTSVRPSLEPNLEVDESAASHSDQVRQHVVPPTVRLPQPLSLQSANHVLAPIATLESRGYHSAADRRTRAMLNRRFSSVASGHERFLKPLEEQETMIMKAKSITPRQVSAPSSPPNWSRHVTLPPIDHLDPSFKLQGLTSLYEPKVSPRSSTSARQKLQGLGSSYEPKIRSTDVSPRSARQKISLSPINASGTIRVDGTGLSKLELAKQLLETHDGFIFENNGLTSSSARDGRNKRKLKLHGRLN